ncbi:MAG: pantoate--beta-alanine ligase [Actinomycetota bacterium]
MITSSEALRDVVTSNRSQGRTIGFVPTMGALHRGHLSLIDIAHHHADIVIVSAFVNPLQFDNAEDFDRYPETRHADEDLCRQQQVQILYRPNAAEMYPSGFATSVRVDGLSAILEGASRPGHFDGVATVVAKLFNTVDPDIAVFGAKDFQQIAVIRTMVKDLGFRVRIIVAPTVRESDGLAMSSRNVRLDIEARRAATGLSKGLFAARTAFRAGTTSARTLVDLVVGHMRSSPLVTVDYVQIVDPYNLKPVEVAGRDDVAVVAAIVGGVRLIDNLALGDDDSVEN